MAFVTHDKNLCAFPICDLSLLSPPVSEPTEPMLSSTVCTGSATQVTQLCRSHPILLCMFCISIKTWHLERSWYSSASLLKVYKPYYTYPLSIEIPPCYSRPQTLMVDATARLSVPILDSSRL